MINLKFPEADLSGLNLADKISQLENIHNNDNQKKLLLSEVLMYSTMLNYSNMEGLDAVYYHLIKTYHWLPQVVREIDLPDLLLLLKDKHQYSYHHSLSNLVNSLNETDRALWDRLCVLTRSKDGHRS